MASIRSKERSDGSWAHRVFFRHDGQQTCVTFGDLAEAETLRDAINRLGVDKAVELYRVKRNPRVTKPKTTVAEWITHHVEHLTGVDERTVKDYHRYVRNDITPTIGVIPLESLQSDDVKRWVQGLVRDGASPKTIANKHGFLSGSLADAVRSGHIPSNPAAGTRLPRGEKAEMVFLSQEEFAKLLNAVTESWRPLVGFLVASGTRWSEATALRPGDVNRKQNTVQISRAWKREPYRIGPTKTRRSNRTINVPASVLDKLEYTGAWLFTNPGRGRRAVGGPVRAPNFRANVWAPAVERAWPTADEHGNPIENPQVPIIRPRIHDLRHTCASWLIQAGTPLPVIQRHLGHESIQTTVDVYGHLDRRSAQEASDVMGKMLE